jgi:hypothetical protein
LFSLQNIPINAVLFGAKGHYADAAGASNALCSYQASLSSVELSSKISSEFSHFATNGKDRY